MSRKILAFLIPASLGLTALVAGALAPVDTAFAQASGGDATEHNRQYLPRLWRYGPRYYPGPGYYHGGHHEYPYYREHYGPRYYRRSNPGQVELRIGPGGASVRVGSAPRYRASSHAEWCYDRYRSYRAWDNSWKPNRGPRRQCVSPFM